eukprot:gene23642-biopygen5842
MKLWRRRRRENKEIPLELGNLHPKWTVRNQGNHLFRQLGALPAASPSPRCSLVTYGVSAVPKASSVYQLLYSWAAGWPKRTKCPRVWPVREADDSGRLELQPLLPCRHAARTGRNGRVRVRSASVSLNCIVGPVSGPCPSAPAAVSSWQLRSPLTGALLPLGLPARCRGLTRCRGR